MQVEGDIKRVTNEGSLLLLLRRKGGARGGMVMQDGER